MGASAGRGAVAPIEQIEPVGEFVNVHVAAAKPASSVADTLKRVAAVQHASVIEDKHLPRLRNAQEGLRAQTEGTCLDRRGQTGT